MEQGLEQPRARRHWRDSKDKRFLLAFVVALVVSLFVIPISGGSAMPLVVLIAVTTVVYQLTKPYRGTD